MKRVSLFEQVRKILADNVINISNESRDHWKRK